MSIRLITDVSFEDWSAYLKSSVNQVLKYLKTDLHQIAHLLTPQLCLDTVFAFYNRMMLLLSFKAQQPTRFAPVLSRFMFFDTEKDGALQLILAEVFGFYHHFQKQALSIDDLTSDEFRRLYLSVYAVLEQHNLIPLHSFCFVGLEPDAVQELTSQVLQLRGEVVEFPEDATYVLRGAETFLPPVSEDFAALRQGKQIQFVDVLRTNKYFLRLVEKPDDRKNALVHARCTPPEFDFVMNIKDFLAVRQRQVGNNTRELDDFMDDIYWQGIQQQALILPPRFVQDSHFFNQLLDPYDYLTSVQEVEIERIQAKFCKAKKSDEFQINQQQSELQKFVHAWQCKMRQAENKPANRHQISRNIVRGFESYNQDGGILNNSRLMGGDRERLVRAQSFRQSNVPIQQIIQQQQFIDQNGELHSHLAVLGTSGVMLAGQPFCGKQQGVYRDSSKRGKKDENLVNFYIRYFSKLDFTITCNVNESIAILHNEPMPFQLLAEEQPLGRSSVRYAYGESKFARQLQDDVYLRPPVQAERRKLLQQDPTWFSPAGVSQFERDFFATCGPPPDWDQFLMDRNLLICTYRALPHIHLRFSPCLEFLGLDYRGARALYDFLGAHRLINDDRLVLKQTIPSQPYRESPLPPRFGFTCGFCSASLKEFCYFFAQTQQPAEHQPQILCDVCYRCAGQSIQAKYLHLRPRAIDTHNKFIIADAFRRTAGLGWLTAIKIAAEVGGVSKNDVLCIVAEYGYGERSPVEQRAESYDRWEEEAIQGFGRRGVAVQKGHGREAVMANAIVSGKRELAKALQEMEVYLNLLSAM
uniref:SWIRM domain-containing protein n=1 Tax=Spironucleus salmonicida TaxID=348837 RepID=V6LSC2_9EUKA|eukprot:EST47567.1 hypothetical protein SS50377_12360 [Spironucleus salmonicida]